MPTRAAALLACALLISPSIAFAEYPSIAILAHADGEASRAEPRAGVVAGIAFAWKLVPPELKDKLFAWAKSKLKAIGRKFCSSDSGAGVETITFEVLRRDVDGDGDQDFALHSELEDDDGDGRDDDPLDETADTEAELRADLERMIEQQHQWLLAHGR